MNQTAEAAFLVVVSGRVQGVNFRAFTQSQARSLGLRGTVRNGTNGRTVHVHAERQRSALEQLIEQLRLGPRFARVDTVDVEWVIPTGSFSGFEVVS